MTYAKQMDGDKVVALLTYDFVPNFGDDTDTVVITEEEYNAIWAEMQATQPVVDPDRISDRKALEIITGGTV